jgi:methylated-DNA-[protein]-cysteine S-methyltransferase
MAMDGQRHAPAPAPGQRRDDRWFVGIVDQLEAYFAGELTTFDMPLKLSGTHFQLRVWSELQRIPYGETISYGELARRLGNPAAVRAVGLANGRNPITIVVPCHRVIGADGSLTGYGGGLERKAWLLDHEAIHQGRET